MTSTDTESIGTTDSGDNAQKARARICWAELNAADIKRAQRFYGELFGWSFEEFETPGGPYIEVRPGNGPGGGIMQRMPQQAPAWTPYIEVLTTIEDCLERNTAAHGSVLMPATTLVGGDRIAWIQDPQGAPLGVYEAQDASKTVPPVDAQGAPYFSYFEICAHDLDAVRAFFSAVFAWGFEETSYQDRPYLKVCNGDEDLHGGVLLKRDVMLPSAWLPFVRVAALDAKTEEARKLGASVAAPRTSIDCGAFTIIRDLEGACLGLCEFA